MDQPVRVRFAPSPTGPLHIGGVRTALFNYLYARKHNGTFILRIEDTDQKRYVEGAEQYITEALEWCRIPYDEGPTKDGGYGPYRQSERKDRYRKYAEKLVEENKAYYAFDTANQLAEARDLAEKKGETFIYNHSNRSVFTNSLTLSAEELQSRLERGDEYVIRFKPELKSLGMHDMVRGGVEVDTSLMDDKVLFKSDGMPTYHLANIVDDHEMEISHVIRGEEWLPSMGLHVLLYEAFGWKAPKFAHLPLIMKPNGKGKLSKRDGAKFGFPVFPLEWNPKEGDNFNGFREEGFLSEAIINFLAMLGWNPGTEQELFSIEELVQAFDINRVNKDGSRFDIDKANWFQHKWFVQQPDEVVGAAFAKALEQNGTDYGSQDYVNMVVGLVKERATFVSDFHELAGFFFNAPTEFDEKAAKKAWKDSTSEIMQEVKSQIQNTDESSAAGLQAVVKGWIKDKGIGFGKVMMPLRLALVGSLMGPDVFEIVAMIGKEETCRRIDFACQQLG